MCERLILCLFLLLPKKEKGSFGPLSLSFFFLVSETFTREIEREREFVVVYGLVVPVGNGL